mmetsp:Transcript_57078/g.90454  ORF Transcript_57078/g.90454 Transcript_57078/m.90454 type:complete len:278 (-) Transcript_57078:64-897(-)
MRSVITTLPNGWFAELFLSMCLFAAAGMRREERNGEEAIITVRGEQMLAHNATKNLETKKNRSIETSAAMQWSRKGLSSYARGNQSDIKERASIISSPAALQHSWQSMDARFNSNQSTSRIKDMTNTSSSLAVLQHLLQSAVASLSNTSSIASVWAAVSLCLCVCICCGLAHGGDDENSKIGRRSSRQDSQDENEHGSFGSTSEPGGSFFKRAFRKKRSLRLDKSQMQQDDDDDDARSSSWNLTGSESVAPKSSKWTRKSYKFSSFRRQSSDGFAES